MRSSTFALLVLLAVVAVSAWDHKAKHASGMAALKNHVHGVTAKGLPLVKNGLKTREVPFEDQPPRCQAAIQAFVGLSETCGSIEEIFGDEATGNSLFDKSVAEQQAALEGFCPACKDQYIRVLGAAARHCIFEDETDVEGFRGVAILLNLICLNHEDEYCFPKLTSFGDAPDPLTAEYLDTLCDPCVPLVLREMAIFNPEEAKAVAFILAFACTTYGDTYCILEVQRVEAIPNEVDRVEASCETRCLPKLINKARMLGAAEEAAEFSLGFDVLCNANPEGEICLPKVFRIMNSTGLEEECDNEGNNGTFCAEGGNCRSAITTLVNDGGCCAANWLFLGSEGDAAHVEAIRTAVDTNCGVTFPDLCPTFINVVKKYVFYNIVCSWYNEHKAEVDLALRTDIAASAGVEIELVTVVVVCELLTASANGRRMLQEGEGFLGVDAVVEADNEAFAADISNDLDQPVVLLNTNQEIAGTAGATVMPFGDAPPPAEEEEEEEEESAATSLTVSAAVLLVLALAF